MHYDEMLYNIALNKENRYLELLNYYNPSKKYSSLKEALNDLFKQKELRNKYVDKYIGGIDKDAAIKIAEKLITKPNFKNLTQSQVENFLRRELGQIHGISKEEDNYQKKIAGYMDEIFTAKELSEIFHWKGFSLSDEEDVTINPHIKYQGQATGDFVVSLDMTIYEKVNWLNSDPVDSFGGDILFENKLSLNKFNLVTGVLKTGDSAINDLEQEYIKIMEEKDSRLALQDSNYDILDDEYKGITDAEIYSRYYYKLNYDVFNQILANYLMLKKLETNIPIFVSSSSGKGLNFKLCSDVINEVGHGNFTLHSDLKRGDSFINEGTREIKADLIEQAIKKVNNYNLWYGK